MFYSLIYIVAMTVALHVADYHFKLPVVSTMRKTLDELFLAKGYLRFAAITGLFTLALYLQAIVFLGPFVGAFAAALDLGMSLAVVLMGCMIRFFANFGDNGAMFSQRIEANFKYDKTDAGILVSTIAGISFWSAGFYLFCTLGVHFLFFAR